MLSDNHTQDCAHTPKCRHTLFLAFSDFFLAVRVSSLFLWQQTVPDRLSFDKCNMPKLKSEQLRESTLNLDIVGQVIVFLI